MRLILKQYLMVVLSLMFLVSPITLHAQSVSALFRHAGDPSIGNPNGSVTIVEFFDYECSHCATMAYTLNQIIRSNPQVRVVFKETPLSGPVAEFATRAALAANLQQKYYPLSHAMLTSRWALNEERILNLAKANGIDTTRLKKDMYSAKVTNVINGNYQLWRALGLRGTPSFYIGKTNATSLSHLTFVNGEMSQRELQNAIDTAY